MDYKVVVTSNGYKLFFDYTGTDPLAFVEAQVSARTNFGGAEVFSVLGQDNGEPRYRLAFTVARNG